MPSTRHHKAAKNKTTAFCRTLQNSLRDLACEYEWIEGARLAKFGRPNRGDRQAVDVVGTKSGHPTILIEAELRRRSTVKNVIKIWRWADGGQLKPPFILFQAFSKFYQLETEGISDREIAEFIGKQMAKALGESGCYVPLKMKFRPKAHTKLGAGSRDRRARELAGTIASLIHRQTAGEKPPGRSATA